MGKIFIVSVLVILMMTGFIVENARAEDPEKGGFKLYEIRFDESTGDKKPTPAIPKSWRFVGVSNGRSANSNNLWFQDQAGNIYLVQGFLNYSQFILDEPIGKINVSK